MEILGIGPLEFLLIIIIMLVLLGPRDMVRSGQKLGRLLRSVIRSPYWTSMMETSREIRELPTKLVRESGLEEDVRELNKMRDQLKVNTIPGDVLRELSLEEDAMRLKQDVQSSLVELSRPIALGQPDPYQVKPPDSAPPEHTTDTPDPQNPEAQPG